MVVMHEGSTVFLQGLSDFVTGDDKSGDDGSHIFTSWGWLGSVTLHTDDSEMIFFTDPDEEVGGIIMENTSAIWPMSTHS